MKKGEGERCIQTPGLKNSETYSIFIGCLSAFLDQTFVETLREELAKSFFFPFAFIPPVGMLQWLVGFLEMGVTTLVNISILSV